MEISANQTVDRPTPLTYSQMIQTDGLYRLDFDKAIETVLVVHNRHVFHYDSNRLTVWEDTPPLWFKAFADLNKFYRLPTGFSFSLTFKQTT